MVPLISISIWTYCNHIEPFKENHEHGDLQQHFEHIGYGDEHWTPCTIQSWSPYIWPIWTNYNYSNLEPSELKMEIEQLTATPLWIIWRWRLKLIAWSTSISISVQLLTLTTLCFCDACTLAS
jgi:hypothetical protein